MSATVASGVAGGAAAPADNAPPPAGTAVQTLWVGSTGGMEQALVERAGLRYMGISTGQLRVSNPLKAVAGAGKMAAGVRQSLAIVDQFRPEVCFVTGGYVCGPIAVASALRKVPILIYLPDMTPGYAIRWLSKLAQRVAVSFPEVAAHFGGLVPKGKAVVTGYPVRAELVEAARDRSAARRELAGAMQVSFDEPDGTQLPLILIWGGSQGARPINRAVWDAAEQLLAGAQVVHVVGNRDWALYEQWVAAKPLTEAMAQRYHPVPYLHEAMPLALAAADLTVARAGASSLGEFPVAHLPAILAPYQGSNQMDNAQALARHGAALIIKDEELPAKLGPAVQELLRNPSQRLQMEASMADLARPDAALAIAREIVSLGQAAHR